jgi:hypothetical protein
MVSVGLFVRSAGFSPFWFGPQTLSPSNLHYELERAEARTTNRALRTLYNSVNPGMRSKISRSRLMARR